MRLREVSPAVTFLTASFQKQSKKVGLDDYGGTTLRPEVKDMSITERQDEVDELHKTSGSKIKLITGVINSMICG